jgi:glycosyltransferase involved in cell wall biosynthesis
MARILTLTNWFPPHSRGGYEAVCHDVMAQLAGRGHEIEVLCSDEQLPDAVVTPDPFAVHRTLQMYWRDGVPWTPSLRRQVAIERHNQRALSAALERWRPEVVSVWHMGALSLNLLTTIKRQGIPAVFAVHDDWLTYGLALDPWGGRWSRHRRSATFVERLLGLPTAVADLGTMGPVTFVSQRTRERSEAASPWHFAQTSVVHAGIDRALYPPAAPDAPSKDWAWRLLYMGRLDPRKGIDTLLRAMARFPTHATLSVVGRGEPSELARLERLAADMGVADRVTFSWVERAQTGAVYLGHDCLVFPSEWDEPFGLVPLEAMACGIPVVATATGGTAEFLKDGENCVRFRAGDDADLAAAIERLADDDALRGRLRANGWGWADRFDVVHMVDAYEQLHLAAAAAPRDQPLTPIRPV